MFNFLSSQKLIKLLFVIYLFIGIFTFKDYGINIEEHWQRLSGFYLLNYVFEFFDIHFLNAVISEKFNQAYNPYLPDPNIYKTYGPIFDLSLAFVESLFGIQSSKMYFEIRHLTTFFIFFLSSIFFYKILFVRFQNKIAVLFGTIFYTFSPRIYGDSFHNNKDILFLSLVVFSIYFIFKYFDDKKFIDLILSALFCALATSTRFYGIFLPFSFIIFLFINSKTSIYLRKFACF